MLLSRETKLSFLFKGTHDDLSLKHVHLEQINPYRKVTMSEEEFMKLLEEGRAAMLQAFEDRATELQNKELPNGWNDTTDNQHSNSQEG